MKKLCLFLVAALALTIASCSQQACQTNNNSDNASQTADSMKQLPNDSAKVLVLLAHPNFEKSKMNAALAKAASDVEGVQVVNIYDYPVNADVYRQAVKNASAIVYQYPTQWLNCPSLLKQWTDDLLAVFISEGLIEGKKFMVVTTTGSEEATYQHDGRNLFTMDEYLRPFEGMANHAKMVWQKPFVVYGHSTDPNLAAEQLKAGVAEYPKRLEELK